MKVRFAKMHGCGNDYVYVDCTQKELTNEAELARRFSNRHTGIGGDGLILIRRSKEADFKMVMYNADGSQGKMCGNGIRCVGKYVYDFNLTTKKHLKIETGAGIKHLDLTTDNHNKVSIVRVNMGVPILDAEKIPVIAPEGEKQVIDQVLALQEEEAEGSVTCVSMGNPHCVLFVEDLDELNLEYLGPQFEHHPVFPEGVNTEFVQVISEKEIRMRVWERGSGETMACGTGACASVVATVLNGLTGRRVAVRLLGGRLDIEYNEANDHVYMTGPAELVFTGEIEI